MVRSASIGTAIPLNSVMPGTLRKGDKVALYPRDASAQLELRLMTVTCCAREGCPATTGRHKWTEERWSSCALAESPCSPTIVPAVVGVVATPVVEAEAITLLGFQSRDVIVQVFANESSAQKSQRVDDDGLRSARVTGDVSAGTATALSEASQTSYVGTAALGGALAVSGVSRAAEFDRAYAVAQSLFGVQFEINDPHRFDWWVTLDVALSDSTRVVSPASLRELDRSSADILFVGLDIFGTPGGTRGETTTAHRSGLLDPGTYRLAAGSVCRGRRPDPSLLGRQRAWATE